MKRTKFLPAILALCVAMCFGLCACGGNDKDEYKSEALTTDNIYRYLAFNITLSDCTATYIGTSNLLNQREYDLSCIVTISTERAADCHFVGTSRTNDNKALMSAVVKYDPKILSSILGTGWLPNNTSDMRIFAQIGYDGSSAVSFSVSKQKVSNLDYPDTYTTGTYYSAFYQSMKLVAETDGVVYYR